MEPINLDKLKIFTGTSAEISIYDEQGSDQAPSIKKTIKKIQLCPDQTHIRFYFDDFYFIAVPMASTISETDTEWSAFDQESGLHYTIKRIQVSS